MVLPAVCWGLLFSGALHNRLYKCMVTAGAQSIWRGNTELEDTPHIPAMHLACCRSPQGRVEVGRAISEPGSSPPFLSAFPSSSRKHEWAVTTAHSPWDMFLFLTGTKAQVRRRQHKAVNRAIIKAAGFRLTCSFSAAQLTGRKHCCCSTLLSSSLMVQSYLKRKQNEPKLLTEHDLLLAFISAGISFS